MQTLVDSLSSGGKLPRFDLFDDSFHSEDASPFDEYNVARPHSRRKHWQRRFPILARIRLIARHSGGGRGGHHVAGVFPAGDQQVGSAQADDFFSQAAMPLRGGWAEFGHIARHNDPPARRVDFAEQLQGGSHGGGAGVVGIVDDHCPGVGRADFAAHRHRMKSGERRRHFVEVGIELPTDSNRGQRRDQMMTTPDRQIELLRIDAEFQAAVPTAAHRRPSHRYPLRARTTAYARAPFADLAQPGVIAVEYRAAVGRQCGQ